MLLVISSHAVQYTFSSQFLTQVLQCIEEAGAPEASSASHKANNAWYKAFDLIYGGVAREYSIPTGKNRYHKFKDKILEVWVALEGQAPGENHCRELSMDQYDRYKRVCAEASKTATTSTPIKVGKTGAGQTASGAYKLTGGKRSYSTAMGGGASLPASNFQSGCLWKNLDESKVLEGLPPKLRSLVHLKQLSKEMAAGTANRAARRGIEEHSKKLDGAYLEALTEFLKDGEEEEAAPTPATEEATDVEMTDEKTEEEPSSTDNEKNGDEETKANDSDDYDRCLTVAFLYRYASTLHEQKVLAEAYAKYTAKCVTFPKSAVAAVAVADSAAAAATGANPSSVADGVKEEATATEDAAVAAAAAVAMEEEFPVEI